MEIDAVVGQLIAYYSCNSSNTRIIILSEYGIAPVSNGIPLNRILRESGLIQTRSEVGGETLDCGSSDAFALCDHQIAHIHINNKNVSKYHLNHVSLFLNAV